MCWVDTIGVKIRTREPWRACPYRVIVYKDRHIIRQPTFTTYIEALECARQMVLDFEKLGRIFGQSPKLRTY